MPSKRARQASDADAAVGPAAQDAGAGSEADARGEAADDLLCPLCHELFFEPVQTPCRHAFCSFCMGRLFEVRRPADVGAPLPERARDCPMCRQTVRLADTTPDAALDQRSRQASPGLHERRGREIHQERERLAARRLEHPRLVVGNLHSQQAPQVGSTNTHDWTFFVRMDSPEEEERFIERVVVHLHPTFRPITLTLTRPPFAVRRLGWGSFMIRADIKLRQEWGGDTLRVNWMLDFSGEGGMQEIELELERTPGQASAGAGHGAAGAGSRARAGGAGGGVPDTPAAAAARAAVPGAAAHEAAAAAGLRGDPAGQETDEEDEEYDPEQEGDEEGTDSDSGGSGQDSEGDAAGDYDLRRFFRGGRASASPASSTSEEAGATFGPPGEDSDADTDG